MTTAMVCNHTTD